MLEKKKDNDIVEEEIETEDSNESVEDKDEQDLESLKQEVERLRSENEELLQKLEEQTIISARYLELLKRSQADFVNYKRRIENERKKLIEFANEELIKKLLPVLDDLHRAISAQEQTADAEKLLEGIRMVERKFMNILFQEGVEDMRVVGELFDPNKCEAIGREETDQYENGTVVEELRKGYVMRGKVIRPALVKVAVSKEKEEKDNSARGD